jgi:putative oxidoreductase
MARLVDSLTQRICPPPRTRTADLGVLTLRLTAGSLIAGHGAQKLFGAFGGQGLDGMAAWLESIGFRPGKPWAVLAGLSEFGGGVFTALGLGGPLGPIALQGSMAIAARKAHWNRPIWATEGGAEVPILYSVIGFNVAMTGPGRYSLDRVLGLRVPKTVTAMAAASVAAAVVMAEQVSAPAKTEAPAQEQRTPDTQSAGEDRVQTEAMREPAAARDSTWAEGEPPLFEEPGSAAASGTGAL